MPEFKVGDMVRIKPDVMTIFPAAVGTIAQDDGTDTDRYLIYFGSPGRRSWKAAHEIELINPPKEPTKEMTPPLSIPALLEKGRAILEEKAERQRGYKEDSAKKLVHSWNALVIAARLDLGFDLCGTAEPALVPGSPPPMWAAPEVVHIKLRPFKAGAVHVSYQLHGEHKDKASITCKTGTKAPEFVVEQGYRVTTGGVSHLKTATVYDLAEAVAVCELQTLGYLDAKAAYEKAESLAKLSDVLAAFGS